MAQYGYNQMPNQQTGYAQGPPQYGNQQGYAQQGYAQPQPQYGNQQQPQGFMPLQPMPVQAPQYDAPQPAQDLKAATRFLPQSQWRDPVWAVLFLVHLLVMIVLAIKNSSGLDVSSIFHGGAATSFWSYLGNVALVAVGCAVFWLVLLRFAASCLVWTCMLATPVCLAALAVYSYQLPLGAGTYTAYACAVMCVLKLIWIYWIRNRIEFTAVLLKNVAAFLADYPASIVVSLACVVVKALWAVCWAIVVFYALSLWRDSAQKNPDGASKTIYAIVAALLMSFYWTSQVIKNVVHVTSAGAFAGWYFVAQAGTPTWDALKRSLTTSFGSIALGSLLMAVLQTIKAFMKRNSILRCIFGCLERLVNLFNHFAFTYVAVYGLTFCDAGAAVWELLCSKGVDVVISEDLTSTVLMFGSLMGGVVTGWASYYFYPGCGVGCSSLAYAFASFGFFIGWVLCLSALEVVHSGVSCFFVCFAEDPAALQRSKPELYREVVEAWAARFPNNRLVGGFA